jgi:hypothetical protein
MIQFWETLDDIFGPILRPILEPIWIAFQDPLFRASVLSMIIWTSIVVASLIFLVYEGANLFSLFGAGTPAPIAAQTSRRSAQQTRPLPTVGRRREAEERAQEEAKKRVDEVIASGVSVSATVTVKHERLDLSVKVDNQSAHKIDMVVVDIDVPAGIQTTTGSFRMQRLGSIAAGQAATADFKMTLAGGKPQDVSGYVEFLGSSYEMTKIPLPKPEVVVQ